MGERNKPLYKYGEIINRSASIHKAMKRGDLWECLIQGWFQGPPVMGPLYGKFPILFPYHSHKDP